MDSAGTAVRPLAPSRDVRRASEVGRRARLELRFGVCRGRTVLLHAYAEPPFRIGRPFAEGDGLHLILTSSAPGVFGGDDLEQSIVVEPGAGVRLTSQSALQVHSSADGTCAELRNSFTVGAGARLVCQWDPVIPFPGARLRQRLAVDLDATARLFWSDAMMAGREARGERWLFDRVDHELAVRRDGALAYLERYRIEPALLRVDARWLANDAVYFGSVVSVGDHGPTLDTLHAAIDSAGPASVGIDRLDEELVLARVMAASGPAFHAARVLLHRELTAGIAARP